MSFVFTGVLFHFLYEHNSSYESFMFIICKSDVFLFIFISHMGEDLYIGCYSGFLYGLALDSSVTLSSRVGRLFQSAHPCNGICKCCIQVIKSSALALLSRDTGLRAHASLIPTYQTLT